MKPAFLIILILGAIACKKTMHESITSISPVTPPSVNSFSNNYLALGDSYTVGQSVPGSDCFPQQTVTWLRNVGFSITDPIIIATTGWTTENLAAAINTQHFAGPFNVVTLLIGVNDQYQRHDTIGYRNRFYDLLNRSIQFAGGRRNHVFVLSIPDYSVTPYATYYDTALIRMQIGWFNAINKDVTLQNYCNYLDITPSTREAANDPTLIASDGLHPSGKEYRKWANRLGPMIQAVLP